MTHDYTTPLLIVSRCEQTPSRMIWTLKGARTLTAMIAASAALVLFAACEQPVDSSPFASRAVATVMDAPVAVAPGASVMPQPPAPEPVDALPTAAGEPLDLSWLDGKPVEDPFPPGSSSFIFEDLLVIQQERTTRIRTPPNRRKKKQQGSACGYKSGNDR